MYSINLKCVFHYSPHELRFVKKHRNEDLIYSLFCFVENKTEKDNSQGLWLQQKSIGASDSV